MDTTELTVRTGDTLVTDLTDEIVTFCGTRGDGLLNVFVPHATAGVALMETGSGSEGDLAGAIDRLLPADDRYRHRHGSPGHGRDHVLPAFVSPSVTVPVIDGRPALGVWQSIVLVRARRLERRQPHPAGPAQLPLRLTARADHDPWPDGAAGRARVR